jgi:hypothetical protein
MAKLVERGLARMLPSRGVRGARAEAHTLLKVALDDPVLPKLRAAEQAVFRAGTSKKSLEDGHAPTFDNTLRKIRGMRENAYTSWVERRDISRISPADYQSVYLEMSFGKLPQPSIDLGFTGNITNTDRNFMRYLLDVQSGTADLKLFSSYVATLGYAADANVYAAQAVRANILGTDGAQEFVRKSKKASDSSMAINHSLRSEGEFDQRYANEKMRLEHLIRELYLSEQVAVELDPRLEITYDPADVVNNNSLLLKSEVQALALRELHRKLDAVATNLGIKSKKIDGNSTGNQRKAG